MRIIFIGYYRLEVLNVNSNDNNSRYDYSCLFFWVRLYI